MNTTQFQIITINPGLGDTQIAIGHADANCPLITNDDATTALPGNFPLPEGEIPWPCAGCVDVGLGAPRAIKGIGDNVDNDRPATGGTQRRKAEPAASSPRRDVATDKVTDEQAQEAFEVAMRQFGGVRKFEPADVTPALQRFAEVYAERYQGNFEFMQDMHMAMVNFGRLTTPQAKGALNCARAEVNRNGNATAKTEPAKPKVELTDGFYQSIDGDRIFKIQFNQTGTNLYGKSLNESTGKFDYDPTARRIVTNGLQDGSIIRLTKERASAYGHLYGRCMICGRRLTDERSIANGIGPVCEAGL